MSTQATTTTSQADECLICLQPTSGRDGKPLTSPGCCGKWFHQECVDKMIATGNLSCPNCRVAFPNVLVPSQNPFLVPAIQQIQQIPRAQQPGNFFQRFFRAPAPAPMQVSLPSSVPAAARGYHPRQAQYTDTEDLLDNLVVPIGEVAAANPSASDVTDTPRSRLITACTPERDEMTLAAYSNFCVNVNLTASAFAGSVAPARAPVDVVCVLDNSGSMDGSKIVSVKEAMRFVHSQLGPQDRLSVVIFNSSATTVHGFLKMTETNRAKSEELLAAVTANGGTDIYAGLNMAVNLLDQRKTRNTLSCVFLLTDGQDSRNMTEKMSLANRMRANDQSLFVFGFGNDHDSEQLRRLANAAEGQFTFVESDSMVVDAFGGALGGQQGVVAKDIRMSIQLLSACTIVRTHAGRYTTSPSPDGRSVVIQFANLYIGEQRNVLVELSVPAVMEPVDRYDILQVSTSFQDLSGATRWAEAADGGAPSSASSSSLSASSTPASHCFVKRCETSVAEVNLTVDVERNRVAARQALDSALALAERGSYMESKQLIRDTINNIKTSRSVASGVAAVSSVLEDLEEAESNVRDETTFVRRGGRSATIESTTTHFAQRSVYSKVGKGQSPYQNISSASMQSSANVSKFKK